MLKGQLTTAHCARQNESPNLLKPAAEVKKLRALCHMS